MYIQPADAEVSIDLILEQLFTIKEKLADSKAILKNYKVQSEKLTQLKLVKKELAEKIKEETDSIENEFYNDVDYEKAKNDELTFKNQIKEKTSELKTTLAVKYKTSDLITDSRLVKGQQLKLQLEFAPTVYVNGNKI